MKNNKLIFFTAKKLNRIFNMLALMILILAVIVSVFSGCATSSAATTTSFNVTDVPTGTLSMVSYDKENKTDEITFTIKRQLNNGNNVKIYTDLKTTDGTFEIALKKGNYVISSNNSDYYEKFEIETDKTTSLSSQHNKLMLLLSESKKICIIGDSISYGSKSENHGWHETLLDKFDNIKEVEVAARGGQTSASLFEDDEKLKIIKNSNADTFIIALGVNDPRACFSKTNTAATTSTTEEYIKNIERLVELIEQKDSKKNIIFISSFSYANKNPNSLETYINTDNPIQEYINALKIWCDEQNFLCVSSMNNVCDFLARQENPEEYMTDDLHPNYPNGTELYAQSVYDACTLANTGTLMISQKFYKTTVKDNKTTYTPEGQKSEVYCSTTFSVMNINTGKYVSAISKDNVENVGEYIYKEECSEVVYYTFKENSFETIITNLPEGCYEVKYQNNKYGNTPLRETTIMYVTGGNAITRAELLMNSL